MATANTVGALDLFGASGTPSWFKPESFLSRDFNPEAYVAELKKFVPLEAVSSELESHLAALKNKLVEVINEDYNDFVSLTTKLVNIDGSVLRMQKPLLELKDRLLAVHSAIKDQLDALNEGLARRQAVAAARATLELMQDTAHVMSKVEKLVAEAGEVADPSSLTNDELDAHSRLLERVAGEVARLKFYATRGQDLPFIHQLSARIAAATGTLEGHLNSSLHTALLSSHNSSIFHCLHAYAAVSLTAAGEQVIRKAVVSPLVSSEVCRHQGDGPRSSVDATALSQMYASVISGLHSQCGKLLEVTLSPQSGLQAFNLLGNSVLAEVDEQLVEHMPAVFSPGLPVSFLANYTASMDFINQLEACCVTQGSVNSLRNCQAFSSFMKRWNLPVYFSLVFQDIAGAVESALSANSLPRVPKSDGGSNFSLQPTLSCWESLQKCVSTQLFLRVMADKFVKLSLQIMARYASWVNSALDIRARGGTHNAEVGAGGEQGEMRDHWAVKATPETLVLLLSDIDMLVTSVQGQLLEAVAGHLQGMAPEVLSSVQDALSEAVDELQSSGGAVRDAVVMVAVDKCVAVMKQLRGIVATFRMTNKTLPTRPSHYCASILTSLKQFLDSEEAQTLSEHQRMQLITCVVDGVTKRYQQIVDETLTQVRKTESSLKRLKVRRAADSSESGETATDTDKMICMQLFLDVQEYGRSVVRYGVQPADLVSFQQLWSTVAPDDKKAVVSILL